jgi:aspartate-alanine antiporter
MQAMTNWASHILKAAPETALFAALALGQAAGRMKFGSFSFGGVAGSLMVALIIGQLTGVVLPDALKAVCFALFIYAVGFKSGPEFFGGLKKSSLKLVLSSVVQCLAALITVLIISRSQNLGKGFSAGLGAGALTQTAMLGTASDSLARLGLAPEQFERLNSQMAVGFAITYVFGTIGVIVFLRSVAPRLLGIDPKQAARELETQLAAGVLPTPDRITPFLPVVARAFEVGPGSGRTVGDLGKTLGRASIERILRGQVVVEPGPEVILKSGDVVGIAGPLKAVLAAGPLLGREIESREALSFAAKAAAVVITSRQVVGRTLGEAQALLGEKMLEGVYLAGFKRQGLPLPLLPGTDIRRGDVAEFIGRPDEVDRVTRLLGSVEASEGRSDLAYHALAIVLGSLLGLLSTKVGGVPVTLGLGGGVLIAGLCFGWLHARYPFFGALPGPAQWILSELGLSAFAAAVGLAAGPMALAALREHGVGLLFAGAVVTVVPLIVALGFGRLVLRLHPVILLGALCGGQTVAAALNAVNDASDSVTPVLGFTMTYAVSNVLLAVWGPVIIAFA